MAQQIQITNLLRRAEIDPLSPTLGAIELPHLKVHEGLMYQSSTIASSLADAADLDMLVRVGEAADAHAVFAINSAGAAWGRLYETPTLTSNGTLMTSPNMDRESNNTSQTRVFVNPTVTAVGTNLAESVIPGGQKNFAIGGQLRNTTEWILKKGNVYLLRASNKGGAAKDLSMEVEFYDNSE